MIQELEHETTVKPDEEWAIFAWRVTVLDRAGYEEAAAVTLAMSRDVDLHLAAGLLERGCPQGTALRILL